ncbi:MAG: urease accessory protein UreF [Chitinophagaceae bacterium]
MTDPTLPIGGYSHSAGLETYVQNGKVKDPDTARIFITEMLNRNIRYTDAAFVSLAYDAAKVQDLKTLATLDQECSAVKLPMEMRQASLKLGMRLLKIFQPMLQMEFADQYRKMILEKSADGHYCIVFGLMASLLNISKEDALHGFFYNAAVGFVTNSVKLIPLSQQSGQEILFSLQPLIKELAEENMEPDKSLIGLCCTGFDIRCMQHEQLYSRLYMS